MDRKQQDSSYKDPKNRTPQLIETPVSSVGKQLTVASDTLLATHFNAQNPSAACIGKPIIVLDLGPTLLQDLLAGSCDLVNTCNRVHDPTHAWGNLCKASYGDSK